MSINNVLSLTIRPSFQKIVLIIIPHLLALLLLIMVAKKVAMIQIFVLIALIIVSAYYFSRIHLFLLNKNSVKEVRIDSAKNWLIRCNNSDIDEFKLVKLLSSSFFSNYLVIMSFEEKSGMLAKKYTVLITRDSLKKDEFRRLKVHLNLIKT